MFARLVNEAFNRRTKGEAEVKVTGPLDRIRNRKARPDAWETDVIKSKLLAPSWPRSQAYSAAVETDGRPAFRVMVPQYDDETCLSLPWFTERRSRHYRLSERRRKGE